MTRLFRAIKDVSRETQHGIILEQLQAGLITDYDTRDLNTAYELYKDVVDFDIKNEEVRMDILKLARDPKTALDNVVERVDALDTDQIPTPKEEMKPDAVANDQQDPSQSEAANSDADQKINLELTNQKDLDQFDKKVLRQIAFFKAINEGHPDELQ